MPTNRRRKSRGKKNALLEVHYTFFRCGYGFFEAEALEADEELARRLWAIHRPEGRSGEPYAVKRFDQSLSRGLALGLRCDESCPGKSIGCHPSCKGLFE